MQSLESVVKKKLGTHEVHPFISHLSQLVLEQARHLEPSEAKSGGQIY